jgi:lipopolysaccharide export system permease protein
LETSFVSLPKTLSAYIATQFFGWFCGVFAAMAAVTFLLDYVELVRRGGARVEATLWQLLKMAGLQLPQTAQEALPFAILFGTMLAFWRLTRSNELVVARAAGISVWQFLTPAVIVALFVGVFAVTIFNPIASLAEARFELLNARILKEGGDPLLLSSSGLWLRQSDARGNQVIIHAERRRPSGFVLDGVTVFFFDGPTRYAGRADARTATLENGQWLIEDGIRWTSGDQPQHFAALRLATELTPRKIEESFASPDTMSFWELPRFISLLERSGFPTARHQLHFDVLLARPFLLCAMVLVAATFSLRMQRAGGAIAMIVMGVASGFALYVLSDIVFALGLSAKVPVALAAWTPTGICSIFGVSMLLHLEDG